MIHQKHTLARRRAMAIRKLNPIAHKRAPFLLLPFRRRLRKEFEQFDVGDDFGFVFGLVGIPEKYIF